ncbi:universal stress protein [Pseudovibrio sp. FO-BEG1]|uniref:universal stress protein n=1 Tax=Pseudovibrio sp. (strain FO-BEG1) TaxID=911045 RepID=UPI0005A2C4FC|nr:universal stress protein [Pseudovibrio sp. FO-BEG1]
MYKDILVPVDLDHPEASEKAVGTACQMAKDYGAVLHFLSVVPPVSPLIASYFPKNYRSSLSAAANERLHAFTAQYVRSDDIKRQHVIAHGSVYDEILQMRDQLNADLIILTSHRPELKDYLLGPNTARIVRHAPCSVMVVREE